MTAVEGGVGLRAGERAEGNWEREEEVSSARAQEGQGRGERTVPRCSLNAFARTLLSSSVSKSAGPMQTSVLERRGGQTRSTPGRVDAATARCPTHK